MRSLLPRIAQAILFLGACASFAQQPTPAAQSKPRPITIDVVVAPKSGPPVADLQQQDFTILDNKVPQHIASFHPFSGPQAPVEVVLVVDAINIPYTKLAYERQQIDRFLRANGGHLVHPTSLAIATDTGVQAQQAASTDGNSLSNTLDQADIGLREIRRSSGFYGAEDRLDLSLKAMRLLVAKEAARPGRKILLWVSPGWPYLSGPAVYLDEKQERQIFSDVVNLTDLLLSNHITLFSADPLGTGENVGWEFYYQEFLNGLRTPNQAQLGNLALQVIAIHSGGLVLNATNDIAGEIERCLADTTAYYEITYDTPPADRPDQYHQIEVKVDKPGLAVRAPKVYYAEP